MSIDFITINRINAPIRHTLFTNIQNLRNYTVETFEECPKSKIFNEYTNATIN
jgi:hypothetical protein